jgi:hypothetical protein
MIRMQMRLRLSPLAMLLLAACSMPGSVAGPTPAVERAPSLDQHTKTYLYVGTLDHTAKNFLVYPIYGSKPVRGFSLYWGVASMAIDRWGDIYTSNGFPTGGSITAFTPGGRTILLRMVVYPVFALGFDRLGYLYAAAVGVGEYRPRSTKYIRSLGKDVHNPDAVAADTSRKVYVASNSNSSSGLGKGSIEVFPPHGERLLRKITDGIHTPVALAFDASGNLYVANCPRCYGGSDRGFVTEYAPGSSTPSRTLNDGTELPDALAVGRNGQLFVANYPSYEIGNKQKSSVAVFAPTGTKPSLKITDGIDGPVSLAVRDDGALYVANRAASTVTVYAPNSTRLLRTIQVNGVSEIAIGKE